MAYKSLGVWSLVLAPDSEGHIFRPSADLLITGAILGGEELVGRERSTVQLVHVDQSDDESDDEDDEDCESCEDDEEDDDEIDAQIDVSTDELMKNSEEADEQDEEEDDDDEEDDSEFDEEDFDDEEDALKSVTIASLYPQMIEQAVLNLKISAGETVMLRVTGSNEIHLVGNYVATPFGDDEDDFDDFDEDEDYDSDIDDLIDDEEAEEADQARIEEIEEELDLAGKLGAHIGKATKRKAIEESMQEDVKKAAEDLKETGESTTSKKAAKKATKKMKMSDGAAFPTEAANSAKSDASTKQSKPAASNKKVHDNGLIVEDIKIGEGADAKKGNKIQMRYIGKLTNGKVFDQNTSNKPFKFILGKGEVIKGWDQGIAGMKVGGERRLTVPANLAYGKQAQGGIPANSTLIFEVKMIGCN